MKRYLYTITIILVVFASCKKDFLDRLPESSISPQKFFNTENDLLIYTNSFYTDLPGSSVYSDDNNSDNIEPSAISTLMTGKTTVPGDAASAGWTWASLRNVNYFLENYRHAQISDALKNKYAGLAKFFRAWFYFNKMKRFGDVPWYSSSLNADSPELFKARDSRKLVADSIIADLDFAIKTLDTKNNISRVTKWTALALKSSVCLFEGTYRKYHTEINLQSTANELLKLSYGASQQLMTEGTYKLYNTGHPESDYQNLFLLESANPDEMILAEVYDAAMNKMHAANGTFITATLGNPGFTKSLIDSYLMKDGSSFTNRADYATMMFADELKNRDPRLKQTIRTPGYTRTGTTAVLIPDFTNSLTGYQCIKYVMGTNEDGFTANTNDLPVFRYAEVLLNFAEARAETGELSQADIDKSINLLRARAGVAPMQLTAIADDPYQQKLYTNVSDPKIIEIRRERRVELAMEGFRYYDVLRWKEGHLLADTFQGMYFSRKGVFDLDGDGVNDFAIVDVKPAVPEKNIQYYVLGTDRTLSNGSSGNIIVHPTILKIFTDPKNYLYPLPTTELVLNTNLKQNTGW